MRARNLKPGFWKNEALAECPYPARLLFEGLWCMADREGRLEDRPLRIKAECFPFDAIEVGPLLDMLEARGFILRYVTSGGLAAIQVVEFRKHQSPHYSEKASTIEAPYSRNPHTIKPQNSGSGGAIIGDELSEDSRSPPGAKPPSSGDVPRELREHSEKVPGAGAPLRGGRNPLNPDSLNPDSPTPDCSTTNVVDGAPPNADHREPAADPAQAGEDRHQPATVPDCPHAKVLALWREVLPELPQPKVWTTQRRLHLRARWRDAAVTHGWTTEAEGLAYFRKLFRWVRKSEFLMGHTAPGVNRAHAFVLELPWLVNPENLAKVIEGKYHGEVTV